MIGIIDYGAGNVRAFANVYRLLDLPVTLVRRVADLDGVSRIIIPGVGAFDHCMQCLDASGLRPRIEALVLGQGMPVLGVCVGLQMLAEASDEGRRPGLGWIKSTVRRFEPSRLHGVTAVPHMGWNEVTPRRGDGLLSGLNADSRFYFLHSYYMHCDDQSDVIAVTDYGGEFACAVQRGNVAGVQFHPEKSHRYGIRLLQNFALVS